MDKTVFISYAWESEKDKDQKIKGFTQWLAVYLKKWGFRTHLDVFENRPGTNLEKYMEKGITESRFVICICTSAYNSKMEINDTGVNKEVSLLKELSKSPFIIPIVEKGKTTTIPESFHGNFYSELNFDTPYSQENQKPIFELISTLRNETIDASSISVEAKIEDYYNDVEKFKFINQATNLMHFETQVSDTVTFQYLMNSGDFKIGLPPMEFITRWSTASVNVIHSYNKVEELMRIHCFNNYEKIKTPADLQNEKLIPIKWGVQLSIEDGLVWINSNNFMAIGKILAVDFDSEDDFNSTVTLQYKILNPIDVSDDFIEKVEFNE